MLSRLESILLAFKRTKSGNRNCDCTSLDIVIKNPLPQQRDAQEWVGEILLFQYGREQQPEKEDPHFSLQHIGKNSGDLDTILKIVVEKAAK